MSRVFYLAACLLAFGGAFAQTVPTVDGARLNQTMTTMKTFGGTVGGGSVRVAYSQENRDALAYLAGLMQEAGLETHIDVAGNLVGRRDGSVRGLAPLVSGSHIDTVPNGGHYDGIVGVMSAIEVARSLHDADHTLRHPLEIIVWSNEEGGKTGSRSLNGSVKDSEMTLPSLGSRSLGDGMAFLGGEPQRIADNVRAPGSIAGYVELHVEQGAILDRENIEIGVVEGIVGIKRWNVTVEGFANHAGTTPMNQRQDAMLAAAHLITSINDIITAEPGAQVGTVGRLQALPGAPNVVPGTAIFSLEIRDLSMQKIDVLQARIAGSAEQIATDTGTNISFEQFYESPAAITDPRLNNIIEESAATLELSRKRMPSGAGHDAQSLGPIAPIGMIFVPSSKGVSHAPDEFTSEQQITNGANVLLRTIVGMDETLR
jgi:N-carbamoyl-L-amino-acid hydrolase